MHFELATVISCDSDGCQVAPLGEGAAFATRYSALVLNRVKIRPGQLVAVDMEPAVPEVAWRWYRAQVIETSPTSVTVQERERRLTAARVPGLDVPARAGDEVWVTGMEGAWELHDQVAGGVPASPNRLRAAILPRIAEALNPAQSRASQ